MPAENQPLLDFIDSVKSQGASDEFVVALLRQNGWSESRIYQAFGVWYEARTGRAVPSGGGRIEAAKGCVPLFARVHHAWHLDRPVRCTFVRGHRSAFPMQTFVMRKSSVRRSLTTLPIQVSDFPR